MSAPKTLSGFLSQVVSDSVNGGSGDWCSPGAAVAAGLRAEAQDVWKGRGPWAGRQYTCPECQRTVLSLEHDGRCPECAGVVDPERYQRARDAAIKRLQERTAKLLERLGEPERAAIHARRGAI
jgi:hypothetical protein